jgi:HEAT repeat protein
MKHIPSIEGSLNSPIEILIRALESLTDGELAVEGLIACGPQAIGPLCDFLLQGSPRTIALPRLRAVRALGGLEAVKVLLAYFEKAELPSDPVVLFSEDAVRSAVARELMRWKNEGTFRTLFHASEQRATAGLIEALGEFGRPEAIPLLFGSLEDDLCRAAAFAALLKMPEEAHQYAILSLRGETGTTLEGPAATRRRRAVAELLHTQTPAKAEWQDVSALLQDEDPSAVLCAAAIGLCVAAQEDFPGILQAIFRVADKLNWLQEDEAIHLLDKHKDLARNIATQLLSDLHTHGGDANWLSPSRRILAHLEGVDASLKSQGKRAPAG